MGDSEKGSIDAVLGWFRAKCGVYYGKYVENLVHNPSFASNVEGGIRIASYILPGTSGELSELIYSLSNLFVLWNDSLLEKKAKLTSRFRSNLAVWLTVIEYLEVFFEMTTNRYGEVAKWIIIAAIQITKTILRSVLLLKRNSGMQTSPAIRPIDRENELKESHSKAGLGPPTVGATANGMWKGQRSGRHVQTLSNKSIGRLNERAWIRRQTGAMLPTVLTSSETVGEILHIVRPLVHIPLMFALGEKGWKPWVLSLLVDTVSLGLLTRRSGRFTSGEQAELTKRKWMLLFYLLRSPFYDRHSKVKLLGFLQWATDSIPLVRVVTQSIISYLPTWQQTYFYNWAI